LEKHTLPVNRNIDINVSLTERSTGRDSLQGADSSIIVCSPADQVDIEPNLIDELILSLDLYWLCKECAAARDAAEPVDQEATDLQDGETTSLGDLIKAAYEGKAGPKVRL
jgi:uncharacterized metal-binding protein YceD (DUF177 family)